jgi:hypothetical protein
MGVTRLTRKEVEERIGRGLALEVARCLNLLGRYILEYDGTFKDVTKT